MCEYGWVCWASHNYVDCICAKICKAINVGCLFQKLVFNAQNPEMTTELVMFGFYNTHITISTTAIRNVTGMYVYSVSDVYIICT